MKKIFQLGLLLCTVASFALAFMPELSASIMPADLISFLAPEGVMTACVSVAAITESCGPNTGGTVELHLIRKADVQTFTVPVSPSITMTADIVPKSGKAFVKWDFAQDTGNIGFKTAGEVGSQGIEQTVGLYVPRMNANIAAQIQNAINQGFIVLKKDGNGQVWVYGDMDRPCYMDADYKSGSKFTDKNGTEFAFKAGLGHVPYLYEGDITTTPVA